jgi:hypothetical protein
MEFFAVRVSVDPERKESSNGQGTTASFHGPGEGGDFKERAFPGVERMKVPRFMIGIVGIDLDPMRLTPSSLDVT